MKVVIAPDSFKGSMSAHEVASILATATREAFPTAEILELPIADGGEGSLFCFKRAIGGEYVNVTVDDPLSKKITARYLLKGDTAIIESAEAIGLTLIEDKKNPSLASSYGLGQLIISAINNGAKNILITLGGSATNDGGAGMLSALGAIFYDDQGMPLIPTGATLADVDEIDLSHIDKRIYSTRFVAMCDVDIVLTGEHGASYIFAPQKGATPQEIVALDNGMVSFGSLIEQVTNKSVVNVKGSGAAGGLGAAIYAFLNAELKNGIEFMFDTLDFDNIISDASIIITGEGTLDEQSFMGKVVGGISKKALANDIPLLVFAGRIVGITEEALSAHGITKAVAIAGDNVDVATAMKTTGEALYNNALSTLCRISSIIG